jgi:hypothetical protein
MLQGSTQHNVGAFVTLSPGFRICCSATGSTGTASGSATCQWPATGSECKPIIDLVNFWGVVKMASKKETGLKLSVKKVRLFILSNNASGEVHLLFSYQQKQSQLTLTFPTNSPTHRRRTSQNGILRPSRTLR